MKRIAKVRRAEPLEMDLVFGSAEAEGCLMQFFVNISMLSAGSGIVQKNGFSQTQYRILALTNNCPGISVGELVDALRVSHQNLNSPMRRLIAGKCLIAKLSAEDRRQKNLFVTRKGAQIVEQVMESQIALIRKAYAAAGPEAVKGFLAVQRLIIDDKSHESIAMIAKYRALNRGGR